VEYAQLSIPRDDFTDLVHVYRADVAQSLHIFDVLGNHGYANMSEARDCIFLFEIDNLALVLQLAFRFRLRGLLERIYSGRLGTVVTKVARGRRS